MECFGLHGVYKTFERQRLGGAGLLLLVAIVVLDVIIGSAAPAMSDQARHGWFTARCADRDLRALGVLEEFGQIDEMQSTWLANAGLNFLQARIYCLSGAEEDGLKLYDKIIAGDVLMPQPKKESATR